MSSMVAEKPFVTPTKSGEKSVRVQWDDNHDARSGRLTVEGGAFAFVKLYFIAEPEDFVV